MRFILLYFSVVFNKKICTKNLTSAPKIVESVRLTK